MATAGLWVYNAENLCVSFFNRVVSKFHLEGGGNKKKLSLGLPITYFVFVFVFSTAARRETLNGAGEDSVRGGSRATVVLFFYFLLRRWC